MSPRPSLAVLLSASAVLAQTVYPIDRAEILSGAQFDFKVEFPDRVDPAKLKVTVNGEDYAGVFGRAGTFIEREDGKDQSALMLRDVALAKPGRVTVEVGDGTRSRTLAWTVYDTGPRKAKNVILFIGDGLSPAHRVAARLLSKGIAEGKSLGKLAIDDMPHMALVATAGSDSIITDSANAGQRLRHRPQDRRRTRWASMPTAPPVRSTTPGSRPSPVAGEAPARPGDRHRHQHRGRGRHAGGDDRAYPPPRRL